MGVLAELKRRKVFKVGAAYLVVAWLVVQAASIAFPAFDAPPWVLRVFILVALLGFPVALVMAWVFDVTPEGLRVEPKAPGTRRMLGVALGLAGLAVAWYVLGQPAYRAGQPTAAPPDRSSTAPKKSIAVLPFTDLSPGHDQEYFSDGVAEEILNALVRVKDLKVAGRTSSFSYKGKSQDLREIGRTLGVAHVLEGSVRKQGERVRITAQLIQSDDGFHLWSETYDGDLHDVFDLQERIARAITQELQVILQGEQQKRLVPVSTANPEAYALYLQATAIFNRRDGAHIGDAMARLEEAIRLDPGFARAHARLAAVNAISPAYVPHPRETALAEAEDHARKAIALDPALAEPYAALGLALGQRRRYVEERDQYRRALELDSDDVTANFWSALSLVVEGYGRLGTAALDRTLAIDPAMPNAVMWRANQYIHAGDLDAGERLMRRAADLGLAHVGLGLATVADLRGDRPGGIRQLGGALRVLAGDLPLGSADLIARGAFGEEGARAQGLAAVEAYLASKPAAVAGVAPYALIRLGQPRRALEVLSSAPCGNEALVFGTIWSSYGRDVRALPEFSDFVRKIGLADLWERHGAPDLCRKAADGRWICDGSPASAAR
jgi:TolB-like protein